MFTRAAPAEQEEDRKDVFGPVADMMVGVVFIFIIMLIALSLARADANRHPRPIEAAT